MPFRPRPHPRPTDRGRLVTTPLPLHNRRGGGHGREPEGAVAPVPNRAAGTSGLHCSSINVYTTVYLGGASESSPWPGVDTGSTPGRAKRHSYALLLARPRARSPRPLCEHLCSFPRLGALRVVFRGVLGPDDRGRTSLVVVRLVVGLIELDFRLMHCARWVSPRWGGGGLWPLCHSRSHAVLGGQWPSDRSQ